MRKSAITLRLLSLFFLLFAIAAYSQDDNISQQIANLRDPDPAIRKNAAATLGKFKDPRGVEPLIAALGDKDAEVRGQAAFALGKLHDPKATKPLIGLLKEKDEIVQMSVSMALGELRDPASIQPLIEAMNDRSLGDGRFAHIALQQIGSAAVEPLIALLKERDPYIRKSATYALGGIKDSRAVDPLLVALHDMDASVRVGAVAALVVSHDRRADEPLIEAFRDPDSRVRMIAAQWMGSSSDPRAVAVLEAAMKDPDVQVRREAAEGLGRTKTDTAITLLIEALKTGDPEVRHWAAAALGGTADPRAVEPLIEALKDSDGIVQNTACESLGKLKDARAVEPLIAFFGQHRNYAFAVIALGQIGDSRAVGPLIRALKDPKYQSKDTFAGALGKLGAPAVDSLIALSKLKNVDMNALNIRRAAISALGQTGDERALPLLVAALEEDNDSLGCLNAGNALSMLKDPRAVGPLIHSMRTEPEPENGGGFSTGWLVRLGPMAVEPLIAALHDPDPRSRRRAAEALAHIGDPRVSRALLAALHERNYAVIAGGYEFYVDWGEAGSEDSLIQALNIYGDDLMARYLVSCGNARVESATRAWEKRNYGRWQPLITNVIWGARVLPSSKASL